MHGRSRMTIATVTSVLYRDGARRFFTDHVRGWRVGVGERAGEGVLGGGSGIVDPFAWDRFVGPVLVCLS